MISCGPKIDKGGHSGGKKGRKKNVQNTKRVVDHSGGVCFDIKGVFKLRRYLKKGEGNW